MKTCISCKISKPMTDFANQSYSLDGKYGSCKLCRKNGNTAIIHKEKLQLFAEGKARCSTCKIVKPLGNFYNNTSSSNGKNSECNPCHHENLVHYARLRKTGFTKADYDRLLKEQHNVCAICKKPNENGNSLSADHCHESQMKRGLLCNSCNLGLGSFKDDPNLLAAAIDYLGRYDGANSKCKVSPGISEMAF